MQQGKCTNGHVYPYSKENLLLIMPRPVGVHVGQAIRAGDEKKRRGQVRDLGPEWRVKRYFIGTNDTFMNGMKIVMQVLVYPGQ